MKFTLNKKNNAPIEVIFFDKNKKLLCPAAMSTKQLIRNYLEIPNIEKLTHILPQTSEENF